MENTNTRSFKTSSCIVRPRRRVVTMPYQVNSDGCHGKLCDKLLCKLFSANIVLLLICSVSVVISQIFCLLNPIEWTRRIVKFDVPATTLEWWRFRMEKSSQQRFPSASSFRVIILVGFVFYFRRLYAEIKLRRNEMIQGGYVYGFYALLTFALVNHSKLHKTYSIVTWYVSCAHSHS